MNQWTSDKMNRWINEQTNRINSLINEQTTSMDERVNKQTKLTDEWVHKQTKHIIMTNMTEWMKQRENDVRTGTQEIQVAAWSLILIAL